MSKFPTVITEEVYTSLYENLKDDCMWLCKSKGIPFIDQEDVFHDTMLKVWERREDFTRSNKGGFSPATFVYLKLRTAISEYFALMHTDKRGGNRQATNKLNTVLRSYERMFIDPNPETDDDYTDRTAVMFGQYEDMNTEFTDVVDLIEKLPVHLQEFVIAKATVDNNTDATDQRAVIADMRARGFPIRHRFDEGDYPTYNAYEQQLKTFIKNMEKKDE